MAGLLYKDFVAIRGKIYAISAVVAILGVWILRLLTNTDEMEWLLVLFVIVLVMILFFLISNKIEVDLLLVDEAKKQKQYCVSLPVTKKEYVAEKYVFMLLTYYIVQSICVLIGNIMVMDCITTVCEQMTSALMAMLPIVTSVVMMVCAVELPFFIGLGYKKGSFLKQVLLMSIATIVIVYLLFGDLAVFDKLSLDGLIRWIENHRGVMSAMQMFLPVIALGFFYISYRISYALYQRRELSDD